MTGPRPSFTATSPRIGPSILAWIESVRSELPASEDAAADAAGQGRTRTRRVNELRDLSDGVVLGEIVAQVDPVHFGTLTSTNQKALTENWVLRFNHLKRLYKLVIRYFEDVLHFSTANLLAPNLQLIAKAEAGFEDETCRLAGLILALVVQSESRQRYVERIQSLEEWVQRELMWIIEQVMSKIVNRVAPEEIAMIAGEDKDLEADSKFYAFQQERSQLLTEKDLLQIAYDDLVRAHDSLKDDHEAALASLDRAENVAADMKANTKPPNKSVTGDVSDVTVPRSDFERLRAELAQSEDALGEAESLCESQSRQIEELARRVDDLAPKAEECVRLKDQMDEYRHATERARKAENALEKYKKKLEESADLRRTIKTLEEQNLDLLDRYSQLEETHLRVSSDQPSAERSKSELQALETRVVGLAKENAALQVQVDRAKADLQRVQAEKDRESEALATFEERVKELELGKSRRRSKAEASGSESDEGEFGAALSGLSTTDLKLQVKRLERELAKATALSGIPTAAGDDDLKSSLEVAQRMRSRYESEWLTEHRAKLLLEARLDDIVSGRSEFGDGPKTTIALRRRLESITEELETLKARQKELEKEYELRTKTLELAQSDLALVDKDQLEILQTLRLSVSEEKTALVEELTRVKADLQAAEDKAAMYLTQVNALLRGKTSLLHDGIDQRDKMLQRENEQSNLRESQRQTTANEQERLGQLESTNKTYESSLLEMKEKLQKAKAFIKQQDRLFKETHASGQARNSDESEQGYRSQVTQLAEEIARLKTINSETEARYRREQQLMMSAWHELGMQTMRQGVAASAGHSRQRPAPASWLAQQRAKTIGKDLRH